MSIWSASHGPIFGTAHPRSLAPVFEWLSRRWRRSAAVRRPFHDGVEVGLLMARDEMRRTGSLAAMEHVDLLLKRVRETSRS